MSDVYEPWQKLVRLVVLGRVFEVPENNLLLRQLQFVAEDIGVGRFCWNAECRDCEVSYRRPGDPEEHVALACRMRGQEGIRLTRVSREIRYSLADALAAAPPEDA